MEQQTSPQWTASRRRNFGAARHLTLRTFTPELWRRFVEMAIAVQPPRLIDTVGAYSTQILARWRKRVSGADSPS